MLRTEAGQSLYVVVSITIGVAVHIAIMQGSY